MTAYYLAAAAVAALIAITVRLRPWRRREDNLAAMEAWLETYSPDVYLPMLRLAHSADTGYLAVHRGPEEAARYRRVQRRILKEYLHGLSRDFHRLHALATESALRARNDRENSSLALVKEKLDFIFSMWAIELCLFLDEFAPCAINLRPLLADVGELAAKARESAQRRLEVRMP